MNNDFGQQRPQAGWIEATFCEPGNGATPFGASNVFPDFTSQWYQLWQRIVDEALKGKTKGE